MRSFLDTVAMVVVLVSLACASAPAPKAPDEGKRTLVNKTVPPELRGVPEIGR